jgi:hypothetical protein
LNVWTLASVKSASGAILRKAPSAPPYASRVLGRTVTPADEEGRQLGKMRHRLARADRAQQGPMQVTPKFDDPRDKAIILKG